MKVLKFNEFSELYERSGGEITVREPVGLAVLGAPAGGKSWAMNKIRDVADDVRVSRALAKGVVLTVDKLRDEFQSKDPDKQLRGFLEAFYLMRDKAQSQKSEYGKWFDQIKNLWATKIATQLPELKITVTDDQILFDGKSALDQIDALDKADAGKVIDSLDKYEDYKRVVRYFQNIKQDDAVQKVLDVTYDEAGDEPTKIVSNIAKLHKQGYVTDVFLIHPENIASNLVQNFYRVVKGNDGGRDSSAAIVQAFKDIEANKDIYTKNAERVIKLKSEEIPKSGEELKAATTRDDKARGDKPIDVLAEIEPMSPEKGYKKFSSELDTEGKEVFTAMLMYAAYSMDLPEDAKKSLVKLTDDMAKSEAIRILSDAAKSGKYKHKFGGVTDEIVKKAKAALK